MIGSLIESFIPGAKASFPSRSVLDSEAAVLATAKTSPGVAAAGRTGKGAKKRCRKQRGQCLAFLTAFCDGNPNCEARSPVLCCEHFARCDVAAAAECILSALD